MGYRPTFIIDAKDLPDGFGRKVVDLIDHGDHGEVRFASELSAELAGDDKMFKGMKILALDCDISSYVDDYRNILSNWGVPYVEVNG